MQRSCVMRRIIAGFSIVLALSGFTKTAVADFPQDTATYSIQDGLTVWGLEDEYVGDYTQLSAVNFNGNVVLFIPSNVMANPNKGYFSINAFTSVFTHQAGLPPGNPAQLLNRSSASQPPDPAVDPFAFQYLSDDEKPVFSCEHGEENLLTTAQAFQNKVFLYAALEDQPWLFTVNYTAPTPPDPTPTPYPSPGPTPAPTPVSSPPYVRNGQWSDSVQSTFSSPIRAMTSAIGQDGNKNPTVDLWLGFDTTIQLFQSTDGATFTGPVMTASTSASVRSLAVVPIVYAKTSGGHTVQANGTFYIWITQDGLIHADIISYNTSTNLYDHYNVDAAGTFNGYTFDRVWAASGTVANGAQGVNAVQIFLTSGSDLMRAEYQIPQNAAGNPNFGTFTKIGGSPLFAPQYGGSAVEWSRIAKFTPSMTLFTAVDVEPVGDGSISALHDSLLLLGTNNPLQTNSLSALTVASNVVVPYGVKTDGTITPNTASDTRQYSADSLAQKKTSYTTWKLLGIFLGTPPFALNGHSSYDDETSRFEIETKDSTSNYYSTETSHTLSVGIVTPDDLPISTDDRFSYSYFHGQETTSETDIDAGKSIFATPGQEHQGYLYVLEPNIQVQPYKVCDWNSTPISLDGTPAGEYNYYFTTYKPPTAVLEAFDLTYPNDPDKPWANGLLAFPVSTDLPGWAPTAPPLNQLSNVGQPFDPDGNSQTITVTTGTSQTVTYTHSTEKVTTSTRTLSISLNDVTFGYYAGFETDLKTTETTTTAKSLGITLKDNFLEPPNPPGPGDYTTFTVYPSLLLLTNRSPAGWVPSAYISQLATQPDGSAGSTPYLVAYTVAGAATGAQPKFTTQPADQSVGLGQPAQFTAAVQDATGVTYQWFEGNDAISSATSPMLTIPSTTLDSAGSYRVVATNAAGSTTSRTATLTVSKAPVFTLQPPATLTVLPTRTARFSAMATAAAPVSYQWYVNRVAVPSATDPNFNFSNVPANLAPYATVFVRATSPGGSTDSTACTLNVALPPTIVTPPAATTVREGDTAVFDVSASSENPIYYMWIRDGVAIPGEGGPKLALPGVPLSANGSSITVKLTNKGGSVLTTPVLLSVVSGQPAAVIVRGSQSVNAGRPAVFVIKLIGNASIHWLHDGKLVPGATSTTLRVPNAGAADAGLYTVRLTNSQGSTEVVVGKLTVLKSPPEFTVQPNGASVPAGGRAVFSARVVSNGPVRYVWLRDGKPVSMPDVSGVNTDRLIIPKVRPAHAGVYVLQATNAFGTARSRAVRLTVR